MSDAIKEAGRSITEYVNPSERLQDERMEANQALTADDLKNNVEAQKQLTRELEVTGVLPGLILREGADLDTDDDDSEIDITRQELMDKLAQPSDPVSEMAARSAYKNFSDIDTDGNDSLSQEELQAWAEKGKNERALDPERLFGKWSPEDDAKRDAENAKKESESVDKSSRGRRDEDAEEDGVMRARKSEGLWQVAVRSAGEGASKDEISREWARICKLNPEYAKGKVVMPGDEIRVA
ncbi:MAG: hypothetical protein IAF58_10220 [Leptolyngbya sp.]|nr:hypothetical protein [Candidatus Melainabacteria bacterium]